MLKCGTLFYISTTLFIFQIIVDAKMWVFANLFIRISHAILRYRKYSTNIQSNTKFGPVVLITWFPDCISMGCHHKTWRRINGKWRVLTFLCFLLWRIRLAAQRTTAQQPTVTVNIKCCVRKNLNIVTLYISDIVTIWYFIAMGIFVTPSCCDSWDWDTSRLGSGHVSWRRVTTLSWALAGSRRTSLMSKLGSAFPNYICPNAGKGQSKSNQVI